MELSEFFRENPRAALGSFPAGWTPPISFGPASTTGRTSGPIM